MQKLRSTISLEEGPSIMTGPTRYRTQQNRFTLICNLCGAINYVDEPAFERVSTAFQERLENPFCCERCLADLEDMERR